MCKTLKFFHQNITEYYSTRMYDLKRRKVQIMKGKNDLLRLPLNMLVCTMTERHATGQNTGDNLSLVLIQDIVNKIQVAKLEIR